TSGPFASLLDLCLRVTSRDLNRRVLEALIKSGACDALGERTILLRDLDRCMDRAAVIRRERESGQTALFGEAAGFDGAPLLEVEVPGVPIDAWGAENGDGSTPAPPDERLSWERETLGMYLTDHPLPRV